MILRDLDSGKVIWQENKDFSKDEEHCVKVPVSILDLRAVSREINFSTTETLKNFRLDQKVKFKGKIMEKWNFEMGLVKAFTTNTWQSTIEAAPESQMMPAKILSGNITIETDFYDACDFIGRSVVRLFYI
jgi:retinal rod rhodopsin-sensitive cGMP 3',5'-cyclic phosphodiesterase subunit delta